MDGVEDLENMETADIEDDSLYDENLSNSISAAREYLASFLQRCFDTVSINKILGIFNDSLTFSILGFPKQLVSNDPSKLNWEFL
jgi:hypothetical protein